MIFASLSSLALLSGTVLFSNAAPNPQPTSTGPIIHAVNVSNNDGGLRFHPLYINASKGDMVAFYFNVKNHTMTQSSFEHPCVSLQNGTDSDFVPVANGTSDDELPTVVYTIGTTDPIWIHCRQAANTTTSHCHMGMVFAINPGQNGSNNSFVDYQKKAMQAGSNHTTSGNTTHWRVTSNGTNHTTTGNTTHWHVTSSGTNRTTTGNTTHVTSPDGANQTTSGNTTFVNVTSPGGANQMTGENVGAGIRGKESRLHSL